jgi:hypothetical protein
VRTATAVIVKLRRAVFIDVRASTRRKQASAARHPL